MTVLVASSAIRTCFGDGACTFDALLRGDCGAAPLRDFDGAALNVGGGYRIDGARPSRWLTACVAEALASARLVAAPRRLVAIAGTGLRELRLVEQSSDFDVEELHFERAVREAAPHVAHVITLSNACSAGGHALALAQDLLELGEADAVLVAAADGMTESMLTMIGRFALEPAERVRPFDRERKGALLGEGAVAMLLVPEGRTRHPLARVLATGMSCDAVHETVPDANGIRRAIDDALARAARTSAEVELVVAHGTGTALNDPTEATLLRAQFAESPRPPLITALKGATGHTSGTAALVNLDVAIRCMREGVVPPVVGLSATIEEAETLRLVTGAPVAAPVRLAQVNAFGFGGVNAVTLAEAVA